MIDELKSFIQVVENENFTKAAKKLNLSRLQSACILQD